jgi:hypothetical protein
MSEFDTDPLSAAHHGMLNALESTAMSDTCFEWPGCYVVARRLASGRLGGDFHAAVSFDSPPARRFGLALGTVDADTPQAELHKLGLAATIRRAHPRDPSPRSILAMAAEPLTERGGGMIPSPPNSAFCAVVDRTTDSFRYLSFGHCLAWAITPRREWLTLAAEPIAATRPFPLLDERSIHLNRMRRVIVCTAGVAAANAPSGEPFGAARLKAVVDRTVDLRVDEQVGAILSAVRHHGGPHRLITADATVLAVDFADEWTLFLDEFAHTHPGLWRRGGEIPIESSVFLG